jgi:F0F1-type ATP synthase epsilon subunit
MRMMNSFDVHVLSPHKTLYIDTASAVTIPSVLGQITVLKDHIPVIGELSAGSITIKREDGEDDEIFEIEVIAGYFEITEKCCYIFSSV